MMKRVLQVGLNGLKNEMVYKVDRRFNQSFSKPTLVYLINTIKCNFRCKQCDFRKIRREELNTDQFKSILFDARAWLGPFYLSICGGEPFTRKDVLGLVRFSNKLGVVTEVITNGSLVDRRLAKKIVLSGLDKITFSLDGARPETHDYLRGFKGSFNRVTKAITILQDLSLNLNISINTTIMGANLDELEDLVDMALKYNLNGVFFRGLMYNGVRGKLSNGLNKKSMLWPQNHKKFCEAIDNLIRLKTLGYPISNSIKHLYYLKQYSARHNLNFDELSCSAPMRSLLIGCDGGIRMCGVYLGNACSANIKDIWYSRKALDLRRQKKNCNRSCILQNPGDLGDSLKDKFYTFHRALKRSIKIRLPRSETHRISS